MRPPICRICRKRFSASKTEGGLVYFKLTPEEEKRKAHMIEKRIKGHPPGREWFCEEHIAEAKKLIHLTKSEAVALLKNTITSDENSSEEKPGKG